MGRRLSAQGSIIRQLYDKHEGNSICRICRSAKPGFHSGNLIRHLQRKHPEYAAAHGLGIKKKPTSRNRPLEEEEEEITSIVDTDDEWQEDDPRQPIVKYTDDESPELPSAKRPRIQDHDTSQQSIDTPEETSSSSSGVPALFSPAQLVEHYLAMVITDGLPITFMTGLASAPFFNAISLSASIQSPTPATMSQMILARAKRLKETIAEEITGKRISLVLQTFDAVPEVLIVMAQFIADGKIVQRLLGKLNRGSDDLPKDLLKLCQEFQISDQMIYAVMPGEHLEMPEMPGIHKLPCLAEIFTKAIIKGLQELVGGSVRFDGESQLAIISTRIKSLDAKLKNREDILSWTDTALKVVFEKISDPSTCLGATDVVASVFKFWIQLETHAKRVPEVLAKNLKTEFCDRLSDFMPINAAIFLDPRVQQLLSATDKTAAKNHLMTVYALSGNKDADEEVPDKTNESEEDITQEEDPLTEFLRKKTKATQSDVRISRIERLLNDFMLVPVLSARTDLLGYWEQPERDAHLQSLARTIHAIPAVRKMLIDPSYIRQVHSNDHPKQLQDAIMLLGGNQRLSQK